MAGIDTLFVDSTIACFVIKIKIFFNKAIQDSDVPFLVVKIVVPHSPST